MPTPREAYQNTVEQQPYSSARVRAADFGASGQIIGRAAQGFGQDLQHVAGDVDDIQTIYATTAAKKADTSAVPRLTAILTAVKNTEGLDTTAAMQKAQADIDALEKEHLAALQNPRARQMFQDVFSQRKANALATISEYEHDQVRVAQRNESIAHRDMSIDAAADFYDSPAEFDRNLGAALLDVETINHGQGPELVKAEKAKVVALAHAKVIEGFSARGDALGAEAWRTAHSAEIDTDIESKLLRANQAGLFDARGDINEANFFRSVGAGVLDGDAPPVTKPGFGVAANPVKGSDYSPVAGARTTGRFGEQRPGHIHNGIDYAAPAGSAIRPPMSGKVLEQGFTQANGNYVKVAFDNGYTGIFLHLKGPAPVQRGDSVDPGTIIGAVGSTGHSTGPHVHYSVRAPDGNYVDPNTVRYDGGTTDGVRHRAQDVDTAGLYDKAYAYAEAHNLSLRETDQLLKRIDVRANRDRSLKDDHDRVVSDAAMERVAALGEKLTKPGQIPGYDALPWQARERIDARIERNTTKEPEANGTPYVDALVTEVENPQAFLQLDPSGMNMTRAEQKDLIVRQAKLRHKDGSVDAGAVDARGRAKRAADTYMFRLSGADGRMASSAEKELKVKFYDFVDRHATSEATRLGRKLTEREYDQIAAEGAIQVVAEGKTHALFELQGQKTPVTIKTIDAARIAWRRVNPGAPMPPDSFFIGMMQTH